MKLVSEHSPAEQKALRDNVCPASTDDQINYFLRVCEAKRVDPFSGLLYLQKRSSKGVVKLSVNPTIDCSRAAAARSGAYAGSDEPEYDSEENPKPKWCKVTVYRTQKGLRCAYTAKCRWDEFKPDPPNDFQWNAKPYHMLGKVTEMQALRKAFPETVSGANEDDYELEVEDADVATPEREEKGRLAVEWSNAVKAFAPYGKTEADLLLYLGVVREKVTGDDMERLRLWFEEQRRDK